MTALMTAIAATAPIVAFCIAIIFSPRLD
jgi:hypothetical protein